MSTKKQIKINRLKNRHILPSIIGTLIMMTVFCILDIIIMSLLMQGIIANKIVSGYNESKKVAEIFEENINNSHFARDVYESGVLLRDISSVCIVDKDNNIIRQYGSELPDFSKEAKVDIGDEKLSLIPDIDADLIDDREDYSINLNSIITADDIIRLVLPRDGFGYEMLSSDWVGFRCWFITPAGDDGQKSCINGVISVSMYEAYTLFFAFVLSIMLIFVVFIYQFCELIRHIINQRRAIKMLHTDFITGGNNRIKFIDYGTRFLKRRGIRRYAVVQLRMEKYRNYCAYHGAKQGEELLEKIYDSINNSLKRRELVAHVDIASFAILLICTQKDELTGRLGNTLDRLYALEDDHKLYFTVGVCDVEKSSDIAVYMNEADTARACVKEDDEDRIVWFNEGMRAQQIWEHKVENDMESALENHEFQVYLQPKYSTRKETLSGAEALVRWIHPTEGFVPPGKFIPIFEKNGFILKLDDFMLTEVSRLQAQWLKEGKQLVPISVNVSRAHFTREDLAEHICGIVDTYGVPHEYIELELTESAFFDDKDVLLKTVNKMKEYGFHVSMDDFGAGYSSLNSLKELPLDVIKLDAEFFRGTDDLERANLIVSRTIDLAKQLGMTIVAEGIETREQVDFLAGQDCDLIQGFYFAKPMPVNDFEDRAYAKNESVDDVEENLPAVVEEVQEVHDKTDEPKTETIEMTETENTEE